MNTGYLDLHGRVRAYQDGKLIWDRPNKITTLGRKALLAAMSRSQVIAQNPDPSWFYQTENWRFNEESWISCYAFGNGASMVNPQNVVQMATSLSDLGMFHMVPLRELKDDGNYTALYNLSEYVKLPATLNCGDGEQGNDYTLQKTPAAGVSDISFIKPNKYAYFKRLNVEEVGNYNVATVNNDLEGSASRIGLNFFETAMVVFKLKISVEDLKMNRITPETPDADFHVADSKVNELGLYIANIEETNSEWAPWEFKSVKIGTTEYRPSLPIMFSHISFPTENFFGNSTKDLDLEYYVYA